jgi:hypothetical protein
MSIEVVSMAWIKSRAAGPFFSKETMRFFRSRLPDRGLRNGDRVYFWTSEQCGWAGDTERAFTLRELDLVTGRVQTVGDFQAYPTAAKAQAAVRDAARNCLPKEAA